MHGSINGAVESSRCWYAVYTAPRCEHRVQTGLACAGFGAWFPHETRIRIKRGRRQKFRTPVFPRYVLSAFDAKCDDWRGVVESIDGALAVLENNGKPVRIPTERIMELQREELNGVFDRDKLPSAGEKFRVVAGPLMDMVGSVVWSRASGRVRLSLSLLNGIIPAEFSLAEVERIR